MGGLLCLPARCSQREIALTLGSCRADSPWILFKGTHSTVRDIGNHWSRGLRASISSKVPHFCAFQLIQQLSEGVTYYPQSGFLLSQNPLVIKVPTQRIYSTLILTLRAVRDRGSIKFGLHLSFYIVFLDLELLHRGDKHLK